MRYIRTHVISKERMTMIKRNDNKKVGVEILDKNERAKTVIFRK